MMPATTRGKLPPVDYVPDEADDALTWLVCPEDARIRFGWAWWTTRPEPRWSGAGWTAEAGPPTLGRDGRRVAVNLSVLFRPDLDYPGRYRLSERVAAGRSPAKRMMRLDDGQGAAYRPLNVDEALPFEVRCPKCRGVFRVDPADMPRPGQEGTPR